VLIRVYALCGVAFLQLESSLVGPREFQLFQESQSHREESLQSVSIGGIRWSLVEAHKKREEIKIERCENSKRRKNQEKKEGS